MAKKARILGFTLIAAAAAFVVVNAITPRYRSESRLLLEARENVFLRAEADKNVATAATIDPEAVTSQIQIVLSRDLAREVIKKEKLADNPEFDPRRRPIAAENDARPVRHRPRPERDVAGRAHAGSLLRPAQRLCDRKIARDRHQFLFGQSGSRRPRRQCDRRRPICRCSRPPSRIRPAPPALGWPAKSTRCARRWPTPRPRSSNIASKSNLFVGSNNTSLPNQQLTEINSQIAAARGQKADLEARARQLRDAHPSGKIDRILRHRQFGIHAPADRAAHRAALAARRAVDHAARPASAHQGTEGADRRGSTARSAAKASGWRASSTTTPRSPATGWRR